MAQAILEEIDAHLKAEDVKLAKGTRTLLEAYLALARTSGEARVGAEGLRSELGRREGKTPDAAGLRQRLKRLNDALSASVAVFQLKSHGGDIVAHPTRALDAKHHGERILAKTTEFTRDATTLDEGALVEPAAQPATLWVMFSYAWLDDREEHNFQIDFYNRLQTALLFPSEEFGSLPNLRLWRDERQLKPHLTGTPQMDEACERSFLSIVMLSDKYPHSKACMREADFFLTPQGENKSGKSAIVVAVNVEFFRVPKRFKHNSRLVQFDPSKMHLIGLWSKGDAADKRKFVDDIANAIFVAARDYLSSSPPPPPSGRGPEPPNETVEQRLLRRSKFDCGLAELVDPRARRGNISPNVGDGKTSEQQEGGIPIVDHLIDWASKRRGPRLVALLGEFGMGKTVTCQLFTQRLLAKRKTDPSLPLPIYFDLRDVERAGDGGSGNLEKLVDQMLRRPGTTPPSGKDVIALARERDAIVIFDGLDEITNKLTQDAAIRLYRELLSIVPADNWLADSKRRRAAARAKSSNEKMRGPRLIVSCRTHYFRDVAAQRGFLTDAERGRLEADVDVDAYFMLPFTREQIETYLGQNLGDEGAVRALALIDETYNLSELAARPILLRFIRETIGQLKAEKLAGRTINLARLYDIIVKQIFERDNPKHMLPTREKRLILQALALYLHGRRQDEIGYEKLDAWFQRHLLETPRLAEALRGADGLALSEIFAQDLRNASLLVRPGTEAFRFGHTSVREYFLADALYAAVLGGHGLTAWDVSLPTPETLDFLLRRHAIEEAPEQRLFEREFPRLLAPGSPLAVRRLAFALWRVAYDAGLPLPRPEILELSGFDFARETFAGEPGRLLPISNSLWHRCRLNQAEFHSADLSHAGFAGAEAPMSVFVSCRLDRADFGDADLTGSLWRDCEIPSGAIDRANLLAARAFGCRGPEGAWRPQPELAMGAAKFLPLTGIWPAIRTIAIAPINGRDCIVSGGADGNVRIYEAATGAVRAVLQGHRGGVWSVAVARLDGRDCIVSGGDDGNVRIYEAATGAVRAVLQGHQGRVWSVAVARLDGRDCIVSGGDDGNVRIYEAATGAVRAVLQGHQGRVWSVAVARLDGRDCIVSGGADGNVRIYEAATGAVRAVLQGHQGRVWSVAVARLDGRDCIVSGGDDGNVRIYEAATGAVRAVLQGHQGGVWSVAVARLDGRDCIVSGGDDGNVRIYEAATGAVRAVLQGHQGGVWSVAVARLDGRDCIVSGGDDGNVRIYEAATGAVRAVLQGHQGRVLSVAVARLDGRDCIVSGGDDGNVRIYEAATGAVRAVLQGHQGGVWSVAVARLDGRDCIVSGGADGNVRIYEAATGAVRAVLQGHQGGVWSVAVARLDGRDCIVSGGDDGNVRIYEAATGAVRAVLQGHRGGVWSVAVARLDGRDCIVSGGADGNVRIFELNADALAVAGLRCIVPETGSFIELEPDGDGGYCLRQASPDAWRDWDIEYRVDGCLEMTDLADMPRAAGERG